MHTNVTAEQLAELRREQARIRMKSHHVKRKLRARCIREALFALLGRFCHRCGAVDDLTFEHPNGRHYVVNKLNALVRAQQYVDDYTQGNLTVLCWPCNRELGGNRRYCGQRNNQRKD